MSRRRSPLMRTRKTAHRFHEMMERLEERRLLTTLITDSDPLTPAPQTASFEYKDARDNNVRVTVSGDVSAEFLFARFAPEGLRIRDHVGTTAFNPDTGELEANDEIGRDLFHVHIAQASIDSYISIAVVPEFDADDRPMQPFEGNVDLGIRPLRGNERDRSTADGTGAVYLGARTPDEGPENSQNIPIRTITFSGLGIMPPNARGTLVAGISTAPGVSIGRFLFGGAVTGQVTFQGSIETFYAGALLTGVTEGQFTDSEPEAPGNFFVAGDIRNILVKGSIGGTGVESTRAGRVEQDYSSGTDFDIRGRVGQIRTGEDYQAFGKISNTNPGLGLRTRQQEIEVRNDPGVNRGSASDFEAGTFGDNDAFFNNDTFETAQFLGSINSKQLGNNTIQLNGLLQALLNVEDLADYYAVPLMAGQRIAVRLLAPSLFSVPEFKLPLNVGVFDPDGRLIASDYSTKRDLTSQDVINVNPAQQELFTFVADKPGIYRIAVAQSGDAPAFGASGDRLGEMPYQLQVTGVGHLGLGGLVANETITIGSSFFFGGFDPNTVRANIDVVLGDLGAVYSITDNIDSFGGLGVTAIARGGEFRAIDANSLGGFEGGVDEQGAGFTKSGGVNIVALTGSVGMIRSRGTGDAITTINADGPLLGLPNIGGDIQYIISNSILDTDLAANGKIGVVQTQRFGDGFSAGSLSANADGVGAPATIDLIDVAVSLGTNRTGGPIISAGPGGNVRYLHVPEGGANVFRPSIFGGGFPEDTTFVPGQTFQYTDDSGANVTITPTKERTVDPVTGVVTDNSGTLTVLSYPIAQSLTNPFGTGGGLAIIRVASTRGLRIDSDGATEIGDIVSTGSGPGLVVNPLRPNGPDGTPGNGDEEYVLNPNATGNSRENSITLRGLGRRGVVDVWNLRGNNFNFIRNDTGGEMVNAQIGQTGMVLATNIGVARSNVRPEMLVEGIALADVAGAGGVEGNVFPYLQTKNAFTINGGVETSPAALDVLATQAIGNLMINGITQNIKANFDDAGVKGTFEGIIGAIYMLGQVRLVDVGEGLLPSGTGNFARAGIYAVCTDPGANIGCGHIWHVIADHADIRGDIVSNTAIGRVELFNGSIINSDIMVTRATDAAAGTGADLTPTLEWGGARVITSGANGAGEIQSITVNGSGIIGGGIIGGRIEAFNIGPVTVNGGFGIFNTTWSTVGTGRIQQITGDGYGLRGLSAFGGQSIGGMTANGNGKRLQTTKFSPGVRMSENLAIDPFFGTKPNPLTDLHVVLGTTKDAPARKGTSASGSIDFTAVGISRDIGPVKANTVRASEFNIPNLFTSFESTDYTDSVRILAGRSPIIAIGKDALRTQIQAAGDVDLISIGGAFRGSSSATVNGKLGRFVTGTTLYGNVYGQRGIDSIRVGSHYGSQGTRSGGDIGEFITNGDLSAGSVLTARKNLGRLVVGGNFADGAIVKVGSLGTKTVIGADEGELVITG